MFGGGGKSFGLLVLINIFYVSKFCVDFVLYRNVYTTCVTQSWSMKIDQRPSLGVCVFDYSSITLNSAIFV